MRGVRSPDIYDLIPALLRFYWPIFSQIGGNRLSHSGTLRTAREADQSEPSLQTRDQWEDSVRRQFRKLKPDKILLSGKWEVLSSQYKLCKISPDWRERNLIYVSSAWKIDINQWWESTVADHPLKMIWWEMRDVESLSSAWGPVITSSHLLTICEVWSARPDWISLRFTSCDYLLEVWTFNIGTSKEDIITRVTRIISLNILIQPLLRWCSSSYQNSTGHNFNALAVAILSVCRLGLGRVSNRFKIITVFNI